MTARARWITAWIALGLLGLSGSLGAEVVFKADFEDGSMDNFASDAAVGTLVTDDYDFSVGWASLKCTVEAATDVERYIKFTEDGSSIGFHFKACGVRTLRVLGQSVEDKENIYFTLTNIPQNVWSWAVVKVADAGYAVAAVGALRAMCEPFLRLGAPTFGESTEAKEPSPFNTAHGWSGTANTLIVEHLIGIKPAGSGWSLLRLAPPKGMDFDYAYSLRTAVGVVAVERERCRLGALWPKGTFLDFQGKLLPGTGRMQRLETS